MSDAGAPLWPPGPARDLDVLGIGQVCVDHASTVAALPAPGEKTRALDHARLPGGQVATALLGCARLGLRAAFVGSVGDDPDGALALAPLRAAGVDTRRCPVRAGTPTHASQIWIERASGERAIVWFRDARLALRPDEVPEELVRSARALHLDAGDVPASLAAARAARAAGVPVLLDADAPEPGIEALLASVDFPVVSRRLAETVHGTSRIEEALEGMLARGARMAVVTLGPLGALARTRAGLLTCPAFQVEVRDTTGAGDAFRAGFLWGLLEGLDAARVLRAGAAAAALNCAALGAQGGLPDRTALLGFLAREKPGPWLGTD